ncbi:adenine nucleotide alpha hydrolases-like protein [Rhizoclosmatium globosum]|uniref:Adenine nucleotide alpha hydrolases-like protein n=1 Tax=Rhizoclosmatium globosum TaxID=329046 RepID=A0A1Y2D0X3_9FUNG|nr:adenine nucleotide alpha hydrolases-like protein [Rhizoclosmatium globosum]|eukprot:ORY52910.1 adenine nucleotide alpha hydrolases-like protein [Rhizoclosmatium globosum]
MCGILFRLSPGLAATPKTPRAPNTEVLRLSRATLPLLFDHVASMVSRRGPDAQTLVEFQVPSQTSPMNAALFSSVLHLRGSCVVAQPRTHRESGSLFCWNGELFTEDEGLKVDEGVSDTDVLFNAIFNQQLATSFKDSLLATLSSLRGPWAIVVYHAPSSTLYFGRDMLGRRSLLVHLPNIGATSESLQDPGFWISSVAGSIEDRGKSQEADTSGDDGASEASKEGDSGWDDSDNFWHELPANGIYSVCLDEVDLFAGKEEFKRHLKHYPWIISEANQSDVSLASPTNPILNKTVPTPSDLPQYRQFQDTTNSLEIPSPPTEAAQEALDTFTKNLSNSVAARVQTIVQQAKLKNEEQEPLAVLFSGGLDCMVLAALAAKSLPAGSSIDLLNVAFDNPRVRKAAADAVLLQSKKDKKAGKKVKGKKGPTAEENQDNAVTEPVVPVVSESNPPSATYPSHLFAVPDRKTGRKGYEELKRTYPEIIWRFVEIDIEFEEAVRLRPWVMGLVNPLESVMDLSIAMAFWFASRGRGNIVDEAGERTAYQTTAKVLLSGLGADEQLGGYNRHRKNFDNYGWEGLIAELQKDVSRISKRNLGRDDRIVSDHGREIRFPYLSEQLITHLSSVPVQIKTDPRLPRGVGDKLLLRQMALSLGLGRASVEVKRAVQFGARSAKMEDGRETGTMNVSI